MARRVAGPWNAAALPEIMAGALQESKRGSPVSFHEGQAAGLSLAAKLKREGVKRRKAIRSPGMRLLFLKSG